MKTRNLEKRENGSVRVATINSEPSKTQQQFKDMCDVNKIIAKFKKTGQITHISSSSGQYMDISNKPDYLTAMNTIVQAQQSFMQLPAKLRKRFDNDPAQLLEFVHDEKNRQEAIDLGLVPKPSPMLPPSGGNQPEGGQSDKKDK